MHQLVGQRVALFARGIVSLEPFRQQDDRALETSDQRAAIKKAGAHLEGTAHFQLRGNLVRHFVHPVRRFRRVVADQLVEDGLTTPGEAQHQRDPRNPQRHDKVRQQAGDLFEHARPGLFSRVCRHEFDRRRREGRLGAHRAACFGRIDGKAWRRRCGFDRCRGWHGLSWRERAEQGPVGRKRRHDKPRQRHKPEGIGRLRAELACEGAANDEDQRKENRDGEARLKAVGHKRVHGFERVHFFSSPKSCSSSAMSSALRPLASARCATSGAARPPNMRSTNCFAAFF